MEQANQATGVADSLLVPNHFFVRAMALIFWPIFVFLDAEFFVRLAHGKHEEEGMGRPRYKGKEFGVVDTEDVVEGKLVRQAELVNEGRHDLRVVLKRNESLPALGHVRRSFGSHVGAVLRMVLRGRRSE